MQKIFIIINKYKYNKNNRIYYLLKCLIIRKIYLPLPCPPGEIRWENFLEAFFV